MKSARRLAFSKFLVYFHKGRHSFLLRDLILVLPANLAGYVPDTANQKRFPIIAVHICMLVEGCIVSHLVHMVWGFDIKAHRNVSAVFYCDNFEVIRQMQLF